MRRSLAVAIGLACCLTAAATGLPVSSAAEHRREPELALPVAAINAPVDDTVAPMSISGLPAVSARAGVPGRTRVLVLRIYWSGKPPKAPDDAQMRGLMKETAAWFTRVSRGRHHLTSKVTPWLKVSGGSSNCADLRGPVQRAVTAARHRGIGTRGFNRFMVVSPQCSSTSFGEMPGRVTWIREAHPYTAVLIHELGHNLGLDHANSMICTANKRRVPEGGKCASEEYGDLWDAMGLSSRSYSVAVLKRLGWAGRLATSTGGGTWTLRDAEHSGTGLQGLRVKVGKNSYWLEYRTNPVALDDSPGSYGGISGVPGLQIRLDSGARSLRILDAAPGNPDQYLLFPDPDFVSVALPVGSSFTTPQRVRITLLAQTATTAKVRVTRNASVSAPAPPVLTSAVAQPSSGYVHLAVEPRADNGQVILGYLLTRYPGGKTTFVADPGGSSGAYDIPSSGSAPGSWTARAVNQVGTSAESAKTSVHVPAPAVAIVSPAPGAFVAGPTVAVSVSVTPDAVTHAAISQVVICLESSGCQTDKTAPYAVTLAGVISGADQVSATATDADGGVTTVKVPVTVVDSPPTVHIDSPADGFTVPGFTVFNVTATATPHPSTGSPIDRVDFTVYDLAHNYVTSDELYSAPYTTQLSLEEGGYTVEAFATDNYGYTSLPSVIHVNVTAPAP